MNNYVTFFVLQAVKKLNNNRSSPTQPYFSLFRRKGIYEKNHISKTFFYISIKAFK